MRKIVIILLLSCTAYAEQEAYKVYNNFSGGELSPLLNMKEDLTKFHSGCSLMENIIPLPQGAAQKRPGTVYVAESKNNTKIRLIPFEFSTEQSYIIELGNQYARFYTDNAVVNDGAGTETLSGVDGGALVAHWLLNETIGTTTENADNPGTLDGTASTDASVLTATGKVGAGCYDLDGQYTVEIADAAALSYTDNTNDEAFSIACWAYVTKHTDVQVLLSKWRTETTTREWRFSLNENKMPQLHLIDTSSALATPVAQWKLNDTDADTTVDDSSGNSHTGTASSNCSTITATGKTNMTPCFDFGDAEGVGVTDHANLSFDDSADKPFSISAWIYNSGNDATQYILSKSEGSEDREWFLSMQNQKISMQLYDETEDIIIIRQADSTITTDWHHVVMVYDNADAAWSAVTAANFITIYIDGSVEASTATNNAGYVQLRDTTAKVGIGARHDPGAPGSLDTDYCFHDKIDNVILFDVALTQANVSALWGDGDGIEDLTVTSPTISAVADDALTIGWHFLSVTYAATDNGSATAANGIILYVDGVAVDSTKTNDADYVAMQDGAEEVRIGSQRNSGDSANEKFWNDKIDEVSIFSDVLTPTEIASLYSASPYELTTPYLIDDLFELKFKQSADVLYIMHPDYEAHKLSRLANAVWTLDAAAIETGPFRTENTNEAFLITPSAITGTITLTATGGNPFEIGSSAGHEPSGSAATSKSKTGALFKIIQPLDTQAYEETLTDNYTNSQTENTSWLDCGTVSKGITWYLTTLGTWSGTLEVQRNYTIGAAHGASGWETVYTFQSNDDRNTSTNSTETVAEADYRCILTDSNDAAESCDVYFRISDIDHVGIVEITAVSSSTSATATVVKTLANTDATHRWAEGAWSNYRGWPRTGAFFQDRLTFGGNTSQPDTIWLSETSNYDNFLQDVDDSDPLSYTLSSRQVNVIEWIIGKDKLVIGTSGAEWTLEGSGGEVLAASTVPEAIQHSNYGSADIQAVLANESVLFFQRGAEKMRELAFNWELDSYVAPDMTILADHITGDGITNIDYQKIPNAILYCVRDDGKMAIFVYERKELITSWSRFITDGLFESVAVITGDPEDQVWVSVNRTIGGSTKRYIEYFSNRYFGSDIDDAYFVDCGITYDSTATTTITGLDHLEAETVAVLGDGAVQTSQTVSSGQVTITSASTVQAGLPFTAQLRTMPLSLAEQGASVIGRTKRISQVIPQYYNSGDFYIGRDSSDLELLSITGMDTSDVDTDDRITFPHGYDRFGYILCYQQSPEPLTLLGLAVNLSVN